MGYGITIHAPEFDGFQKETDEIISFGPDWIGHFLFFSEKQLLKVNDQNIVIEICPSSNYVSMNFKYFPSFIDYV